MHSFAYTAPATLAEALEALAAAEPGTKVLAGGTTLYDLMKLDIETPSAVVDVHALSELAGIDTAGPGELSFGAGALMADVAADPVLVSDYPALAESLVKAASQQLRNMATVGGNLLQRTRCAYFRGGPPFPCNKRRPGSGCAAIGGLDRGHALLGVSDSCIATYPGDWAVALLAFDAVVDVAGPRGERTVPLAYLHLEPGNTPDKEHTLAADELILRIRVPATPTGRGSTYHKIRDRESYAFALVSAAVAVALDGGGIVQDCRIALGGVATRPWRCHGAERELLGEVLNGRSARRAGETAFAGARPGTHNAFRIELGIRTVAEALRIAGERAAR
ncbi:FAD binding domain-containing protein [Nonomuraea zeae]|uniref:Xanthine dehydrogenase family protein subunit M n=1 Tax=Nonomuraea zeae TaxID=1642303 RepID=A0A5S4GQA0_9ACTN|nr:xanthine dehydrogenase family protein subunit M [Nonomuraea zeae]TMR35083.1 xanthine dehydrogenase family protein subunit M [Nonomuraea zeae]